MAIFALALAAVFFKAPSAFGQTPPNQEPAKAVEAKAIATVNFYGPKIVSREGNTFKISFIISNREMSQSGVRYGVQLTRNDGGAAITADEYVFPESLDLHENETMAKEITYQAPAFLSGDYSLQLKSRNSSSLLLALADLGKVKLAGNAQYVEINPASCYLAVGNENNKYLLRQGVDVAATEELFLNCDMANHFTGDVSLQPKFQTFKRSVYGEEVKLNSPPRQPVALVSGEKKSLRLAIPKASQSQAYDVRFALFSGEKPISNSVIFHYVLRGQSATIQNLRFDKDYYAAGETAHVSFYWTPSADSFIGSRAGSGTDLSGIQLEVAVAGSGGENCSKTETRQLDNSQSDINLDVAITANCPNPVFSARIKNSDGTVLDAKNFGIASAKEKIQELANTQKAEPGNKEDTGKKKIYQWAIVVIIIITLIAFAVIVLWKKKGIDMFKIMLLCLAGGTVIFSSAELARADTFVVWSGPIGTGADVTYIVSIDKTTYDSGAAIVATGSISEDLICDNIGGSVHSVKLTGNTNGASQTFFDQTYSPVATGDSLNLNATKNFTAANVAVKTHYSMVFDGYFQGMLHSGVMGPLGHTTYSMGYDVLPPDIPPAVAITSPVTSPPPSNFTETFGNPITFQGYGTDSDGTVAKLEWWDGGCGTGTFLGNGTPITGIRYTTRVIASKLCSSPPLHSINLRALDNRGAWSSCQNINVTINPKAALECSTAGSSSGFGPDCYTAMAPSPSSPAKVYLRAAVNNKQVCPGDTYSYSFYCDKNDPGPLFTVSSISDNPYVMGTNQYCSFTSAGSFTPKVIATVNYAGGYGGLPGSSPPITATADVSIGYACSGANPPDLNSSMCADDERGLQADTPAVLVQGCTSGTKCEYVCNTGFTWQINPSTGNPQCAKNPVSREWYERAP